MTCACLTLLAIAPQWAWAVGTAAGTIISNTATLSYITGLGATATAVSNITFRVDEIIQPVLIWQDAAAVAVTSPGSNAVLTFLLTNSGNGPETFSLARTNGPAPQPAENYTPLNGGIGSIYLESGALPGFQATGPNADLIYLPSSNDPTLAPNAGITVYVISDTPNVANNARGEVRLSASSRTLGAAGASPGTALAGLGQGGGFAVVGTSRAQANATGGYIASSLRLVMNKTVLAVRDPRGTNVVMPAAVLTYQIVVTLSGSGVATNFMVTDPLPADTVYVPGSVVLDGVAQTDAADTDQTQFVGATDTISVSLGNVTAPASFVITFRATIK